MKKKGIEALAREAARMLKSGADVDALSDRFCKSSMKPCSRAKGADSSWSGRFTLDLDIRNFRLGTYRFNVFNRNFARDLTINFKETASVPEPSSLALPGLAPTGLGFSRKLKGTQSRA